MSEEKDSFQGFFNKVGKIGQYIQEGYKKATSITGYEVFQKLENLQIKKAQYTDEKKVEKIIFDQLEILYKDQVHRQYNIQGYLGLKCDIDLGDGQVGIELKLANQLSNSSSNIERLLGQVLYYSKRTYKENLIVIVVGLEKEYDLKMKELQSIVEEQKVYFYYLIVK
jgi:hypothetical protein